MSGKKVICFSLWGNNYRYIGGALQNADLAEIYYPDWICRYYVGSSTPNGVLSELSSRNNTEIIRMDATCDWTGMFWRFLAASDNSVEIMISRDCDSRLHKRESNAVYEWIESEMPFHIIRDHSYHSVPILGGMWGVKNPLLQNMGDLVKSYIKSDRHGIDQDFLGSVIYPLIKEKSIVHDPFFQKIPFPVTSGERTNEHFVGQAYDGDGSILDVDHYGKVYFSDYLAKFGIKLKNYDEFKSTN
jgi:hypothetical protein